MSQLKPALLIRGQWGLGDNILGRAFIKELAKVHTLYLETPWPEIYSDLEVRFVRGQRNLRTQLTAGIIDHAQRATRCRDPTRRRLARDIFKLRP